MQDRSSLIKSLLLLPDKQRQQAIASLSNEEAQAIFYDWRTWARPEQIPPPGNWSVWLIESGRGFGKTRTGAEWIKGMAQSGLYRRFHLVARTAADVRDVMMEGESGLLAISHPSFMPKWRPSIRRVEWPNGAVATTFSADEPDALRGPQCEAAWADELASWRYPDAWDMLLFGLRLGPCPRVVVTTTPRPTKLIKELRKDASTVVTKGTTYDNRDNLAPAFYSRIINRYEGTRLGRQELKGELLEDNPNALWQLSNIERLRVKTAPQLRRVVVAIDPAATNNENSDETGIVGAGVGVDGHGYVLADESDSLSPDGWGKKAVKAFRDHKADRIVAEVNNGGDMVEFVIRTVDPNVPYKSVNASRGKAVRAEPVAALYEQAKIHHVGIFPILEDQMCEWDPSVSNYSPDRLDALVWAFTELMFKSGMGFFEFAREEAEKIRAKREARA
jgi:phage terminase large subunit-like protein